MPKRAASPSPQEGRPEKRRRQTQRDVIAPKPVLAPLIWSKTLRRQMERAARKAPPFLFEFGLLNDRSHSAIFNADNVRPQFFETRAMPSSIFRMPLQDIRDLNKINFNRKSHDRARHGLWSIWEPSLQSVVRQAISYCKDHKYSPAEVFVAVIDTNRIKKRNIVLHERDFHLVQHEADIFEPRDDWYYAFGVIPAGGFALVTLDRISAPMLLSELFGRPDEQGQASRVTLTDIFGDEEGRGIEDIVDEIILAKKLGALFGKDFEFPVACMAVASLTRHPNSHIKWLDDECMLKSSAVAQFQDYGIPRSWFQNFPSKSQEKSLHRVPDARRGMSLLRAVVKNKSRKSSIRKINARNVQPNLTQIALGAGEDEMDIGDDDASFHSSSTSSSVSDDDASFDASSDDEKAELPLGEMDSSTKRVLLEARRRTPRYLFRAWRNDAYASGGYQGLNTTEAITPRAFFSQIASITLNVLKTRNSTPSSAHGPVASTVIDTRALPNVIIHVPSLGLILDRGQYHRYDHEYLAHGVISGPAHKAVPFQVFQNIGVGYHLKSELKLYTSAQWKTFGRVVTQKEIDDAKSVASQYGPRFGAAVMVAILCVKQRDGTLWRNGFNDADKLLNDNMLDFEVPSQLCKEESVLTDIVYTNHYHGLEQMIRMLRAIVDLRHGRGARNRKSAAAWVS
ncbi:hypothetical protein BST61_g2383 [Cercospora zeina]